MEWREDGIEIGNQSSKVYIINNIVAWNNFENPGFGGIRRTGGNASEIMLLNNLIVGNGGNVNDLVGANYLLDTIDHGNLTTNGNEGVGVSLSSQAGSDIFDNSSDFYKLKEGSVAIDNGVNNTSIPGELQGMIPNIDIEGDPRPQGAAIDIGADEYIPDEE